MNWQIHFNQPIIVREIHMQTLKKIGMIYTHTRGSWNTELAPWRKEEKRKRGNIKEKKDIKTVKE